MADNTIANKIMSNFIQNNYCEYVQYLVERDAINIQMFQFTDLGKVFWIDLRWCFKSVP